MIKIIKSMGFWGAFLFGFALMNAIIGNILYFIYAGCSKNICILYFLIGATGVVTSFLLYHNAENKYWKENK